MLTLKNILNNRFILSWIFFVVLQLVVSSFAKAQAVDSLFLQKMNQLPEQKMIEYPEIKNNTPIQETNRPINDDIYNAKLILISEDPCFAQKGGNKDASPDFYGDSTKLNHKSVWYKFKPISASSVNIEVLCEQGFVLETSLVKANCSENAVSDFKTIDAKTSSFPYVFTYKNLDGDWYYLMVSSSLEYNLIDFEICFKQN